MALNPPLACLYVTARLTGEKNNDPTRAPTVDTAAWSKSLIPPARNKRTSVGRLSRTPKDAMTRRQVRRFSDTTIAYYARFAGLFWNGTRYHDVDQNYAAFIDR